MGKYKNVIIYTAILIILMVVAVYGYNYLKEEYQPDRENQSAEVNDIIETPSKAKDFKAVSNSGEEVSLSKYFGKPIIVNFWETWCAPCKMELPEFNDAYLKYGDEIQFMMVNLTDAYKGDTSTVKKFVNDNGYQFPVYFDIDNSAAISYSIYSIPKTIFIDKNGDIAYTFLGMLTGERLEWYIEKLLK